MLENNQEKLSKLADEFQIGKNSDSYEQIRMLDQLDKLPKKETIEILNFFVSKETNPQVLLHIIKTLGKYNDISSTNILIDLLLVKGQYRENLKNLHEYIKVRCTITSVLANMKNKDAITPLLDILSNDNEDYKLRLSAAEALGKIGDRYAVTPLIDIISNDEEKSLYLKESAVKALGMLGDIRAIDPLVTILETKKGIIDKYTFLRERVIEAINKLGFKDDRVFKALRNSLNDESPYIRLNAIEALVEIDDDRVLDLIRPLVNDEEEDVARTAIDALYEVAGKDYIVKLYEQPDLAGWCVDEIETILTDDE